MSHPIFVICHSPQVLKKLLPHLQHLPPVSMNLTEPLSSHSFDVQSNFFPHLRTKQLGHTIFYASSMTSTQEFLLQSSFHLDEGVICIADQQTNGVGRGSNTWESPHGCLMFSFKSYFTHGANLPFVQYLVSLALIKTVKSTPEYATINLKIKWPNDIYANDMKIGGVLCKSTFEQGKFAVITGVGINVSNEQPTTCINQLLRQIKGNENSFLSREQFLQRFCNIFEEMQMTFNQEGFASFEKEYIENWMHSNQKVVVQGKEDADLHAVIQGITSTGCLHAIDSQGQSFELYPDGNSFDFFSGLLKRKIN